MGGDRELVMFSGLGAILTAAGGFSLVSALCGLVFWLTALYWLRRWNKADPMMRHVWLRHLFQQDYYLARTSLWHKPRPNSPWRKGK
jgi:type IV secretory pathway TrbD component